MRKDKSMSKPDFKLVIHGDETVVVPIEEYNNLVVIRAHFAMIVEAAGEDGYGSENIIAAIKRIGAIPAVVSPAEPAAAEAPEKPVSPNVPKYANVPLDILPGDKVRYIGQAGKDCGECKAGCYPTPGAVGTVERVGIAIHGDAHSIEVLWPNGRWSGSPSDLAFVSREGAPC